MKFRQRILAVIFTVAALITTAVLLAPQNSMAAGAGGRPTAKVGEIQEAPPNLPPDARFKTDALVIVAHPDDETEIGSYLARLTFDEHKRVAAIYGTPGNGGGIPSATHRLLRSAISARSRPAKLLPTMV
jgi:hypothetical protein